MKGEEGMGERGKDREGRKIRKGWSRGGRAGKEGGLT